MEKGQKSERNFEKKLATPSLQRKAAEFKFETSIANEKALIALDFKLLEKLFAQQLHLRWNRKKRVLEKHKTKLNVTVQDSTLHSENSFSTLEYCE